MYVNHRQKYRKTKGMVSMEISFKNQGWKQLATQRHGVIQGICDGMLWTFDNYKDISAEEMLGDIHVS